MYMVHVNADFRGGQKGVSFSGAGVVSNPAYPSWEIILGPNKILGLSSSCGSFKIGFGFVCAYLWTCVHHSVCVVVRGQLLGFLV